MTSGGGGARLGGAELLGESPLGAGAGLGGGGGRPLTPGVLVLLAPALRVLAVELGAETVPVNDRESSSSAP